jgi:predicted O-linked N-acetylglucosamine transferase (SPINDLY family)
LNLRFGRFNQLGVVSFSRNLGIDIAIDLKGYTRGSRAGIFALRAAPIQVNYLGYPGTMAADFIDYLIADETVIPLDSCQHYAEKIVYLPNSYQVNDDTRQISTQAFSRSDCGLPTTGFIFCCFNNTYKITPELFACWMRILNQVSDSVLWPFQDNQLAVENLRKIAVQQGVAMYQRYQAGQAPELIRVMDTR